MQFYETSAMVGTHVDDVFMEMAKAALKRDSSKDFQVPTSGGNQPLKLS